MGSGAKRRSTGKPDEPHFVGGKSQSRDLHSRSVGYSYAYPSDPIQIATSPYDVSHTPPRNCDSLIVAGGAGLGYPNEEEEDEYEEEGNAGLGFQNDGKYEDEDNGVEESESEGFITIGGVRIYTEDCSSPESESESEPSDDESDDSDSSVDEEMASDYLVGIGGSNELLKSVWLAAKSKALERDFDFLESGSSGDDEKVSEAEMMKASKEYGMMKKSKKKINIVEGSSEIVDIDLCGAMEDLMLGKDMRRVSGRRKKKNAMENIQLAKSREGRSKGFFPGEKKKHRKELIAAKRQQRMINRGVDLEQINLKLKQMVVDEATMLSFHAMLSRDCSQVQRLASIYRLRSTCQGSGKKR